MKGWDFALGVFIGNFVFWTIAESWMRGLVTGLLAAILMLLFWSLMNKEHNY